MERIREIMPDFLNSIGVGQMENRSGKSLSQIKEESDRDLRRKLAIDKADHPEKYGKSGGKRLVGTDVTSETLEKGNDGRTVAHMNDDN